MNGEIAAMKGKRRTNMKNNDEKTMNQQVVLRDTPKGLPVNTRVRAGATHKGGN